MSKDQVSGSLTLSLSGLADAVAERVATTLRAELLAAALRAKPRSQDHLSLDESIQLLVSQIVPVAYGDQVGKSIAARLWDLGYRVTGPVDERPSPEQITETLTGDRPTWDRPGPAETFFREGV